MAVGAAIASLALLAVFGRVGANANREAHQLSESVARLERTTQLQLEANRRARQVAHEAESAGQMARDLSAKTLGSVPESQSMWARVQALLSSGQGIQLVDWNLDWEGGTVRGTAPSPNAVYEYVGRLRSSGVVSSVQLGSLRLNQAGQTQASYTYTLFVEPW